MRTIAVTGTGSGIGAATARMLCDQGHRVIGVDIRNADVEADLSTPAGRARTIEAIRKAADGRLNGLVAAAGVSASVGDERKVVATNFFGAAELLLQLREDLAASEAPAALVVTSLGLLRPYRDPEVVEACLAMDEPRALELIAANRKAIKPPPAYSSSKLAIALLVRTLAPQADWAGRGITLNAIAPGITRTPMTAGRLATPEGTAILTHGVAPLMGRFAEPEDIADIASYLVSGRARYMSGQVLFVDGGMEALLRKGAALQPVE